MLLFEPLHAFEPPPPPPRPHRSWEEMLAWVEPHTRELVKSIEDKVASTCHDVIKEIHGKYCYFYKGKPSPRSRFAVIYLTKSYPRVVIRTDPKTFKDPERLTGDTILKGWFFKPHQEKAFSITNDNQINYAIELIKQSYELAK